MEIELKFNSKRQQKDFETIYYNMLFDDTKIWINNFGCIIIDLFGENSEYLKGVEDFINGLNNKNIKYNKIHQKISIS